VRALNLLTQIVSTLAGTGSPGFGGRVTSTIPVTAGETLTVAPRSLVVLRKTG
jgi:hypothetical protein